MRIGIIKLGAKGDVLRTMPILIALKKKFKDSEIIWITKKESKEILEKSRYIKEIITIPIEKKINFDILYNFDVENSALELFSKIESEKKYGFFLNDGYPSAINFSAEYYLNTIFDDELKKYNKKTYQEMIFDTAELPYNNENHLIYLTEDEKKYGENFLEKNNLTNKKIIGIHIGSSKRWPSKRWHSDNVIGFITEAKNKGYEIILFAGSDEKDYVGSLTDKLNSLKIKIYRNNIYNTDKEFFSLINICDKIVSGDTFAMHASISLNKKTIGLFFCTSPDEVEGYGLLTKIISPMLYNFFPEKSDKYSEELTKSISAEEVIKVL